jgi:mono/diheme cytochrome c family protein
MHGKLMMVLSSIVLSAALVACVGGVSSESPEATGEKVVMANACGACHTGSKGTLAGGDVIKDGVYAPNLTPDMDTGLGGWTADEITTAISKGKDDQGQSLCGSMPRFGMLSQQDLADIAAYLRSLPAVKNQVPDGTCTNVNDN